VAIFYSLALDMIHIIKHAMKAMSIRIKCWAILLRLSLASLAMTASGASGEITNNDLAAVPTTIAQLRQLFRQQTNYVYAVRLEGDVLWVNSSGSLVVLSDESGVAPIWIDPVTEPIKPGQKIVLSGHLPRDLYGASLRVENMLLTVDALHGMDEKKETLQLSKGRHPIVVSCYDAGNLYGLRVMYEGPGLFKQRIPSSALSCAVESASPTNCNPGLNYQVFEGQWDQVPDFAQLKAIKTGVVSNFDPSVRTRDSDVGIEFNGLLDIPTDGQYTFSISPITDDKLRLCHSVVNFIGQSKASSPLLLSLGQPLLKTNASVWAEVEGVVTFCSREDDGSVRVMLRSGTGTITAEMAHDSFSVLKVLPGCRVRVIGICQSALTFDGDLIPEWLWVPSLDQIEIADFPPELGSEKSKPQIEDLLIYKSVNSNAIVRASGQIVSIGSNEVVIGDATGKIDVKLAQKPIQTPSGRVEVLAQLDKSNGVVFLKDGFLREISVVEATSGEMPALSSTAQIKHLTRQEALKENPVQIRGVVTWSEQNAVVLQDASGSVFIDDLPTEKNYQQRVGEVFEIKGVTTARFSPMVLCKLATRIGLGVLPEPVHASGDQLKNGSLDTEYVEIQGAVLAIHDNMMKLLTHDGQISVEMLDAAPGSLSSYEGGVVRIRGCLWAVKDEVTHLFKVSEIQMHQASISLDQAAPEDPFTSPAKRVSELLLYDANARAFQTVKIKGQIIHELGGEYFLQDGASGLRFTLKKGDGFLVGDMVEVVGYPDLGGVSPALQDAVARKIESAPMPKPQTIDEDNIQAGENDSTWVQIRAKLVNVTHEPDQIMTLQMGSHYFLARLSQKLGSELPIQVGGQLELTGTYAALGKKNLDDGRVGSFELMINSPADIRVLARPPWWTIRKVLAVLGFLSGVLILSLMWISMLQRKVEQRSAQLKIEIHGREQAESKRAIESERSRISRDLHDDLGATVTEISMLADAGLGSPPNPERGTTRFRIIAEKGRAMVSTLDSIVWLVNPAKDSLPHFVNYVSSFAEEYCSKSNIACRLNVSHNLPSGQMSTEMRHNLFLATKESLTNVLRHAGASEVEVGLAMNGGEFIISINDNGRGFVTTQASDGNGLANLEKRLEAIGGRCEIKSQSGVGTNVSLILPMQLKNGLLEFKL